MVSPGPPAAGEPVLASPGPPVAGSSQIDPAQDISSTVETQSSSSQLTGGQSVEPVAEGRQSVDPAGPQEGPPGDPYTGGQSGDPYTGGQTSDPFTGQSGGDPYGGQSVSGPDADPFTGGQSTDPYTGGVSPAPPDASESVASTSAESSVSQGADVAAEQTSSAMTGEGAAAGEGGVEAAATTGTGGLGPGLSSANAPGDFEFEDSVANSLRSEARDVVGEDLAESFQSGTYSENALVSTESLTPDQLAEWSDYWESGARSYGQFVYPVSGAGQQVPFDVSHVPDIGTDPVGAGDIGNSYATDPNTHFDLDHAGSYNNDRGITPTPTWNPIPSWNRRSARARRKARRSSMNRSSSPIRSERTARRGPSSSNSPVMPLTELNSSRVPSLWKAPKS